MIRVHKPAAPAVLAGRGQEEARSLREAYDRGERAFEFDAAIYRHSAVKAALKLAQHEKCAFCEGKITANSYGDVEHFRPKGACRQRVGGRKVKPGYYWLAYDWSNLLLSCEVCNQSHKRDLFPLANPSKRAVSHHCRMDDERPLLIHSGEEDPESHIGFREEAAFAIDGGRRGATSIEVFGLNRPDLLMARRIWLDEVKLYVESLKTIELLVRTEREPNHLARARATIAQIRAMLARVSARDAVFSAMVRAFLDSAV